MEIMNFISQPQVMITLAALILLLWRISYGYKYGLISELLEIAALAVGFSILTMSADFFEKIFHGENLHIVTMVIRIVIVLVIYRAIQGITKGVRGVKKIPIIGSADKLLGACFGVLEIYIWMKLLNYVIGYDFWGAIRYTVSALIGYIKIA